MTTRIPGPWPTPAQILLLTYERADHLITTLDHSVVGIPSDLASITKASRARIGDWVLIRISELAKFVAGPPARVIGKPLKQGPNSAYPDLLWEAEEERGQILYPLRIPVTFDGGPHTKPGCINWESLARLRFRGTDGYLTETPQQWGKKFTTNVIDNPGEVHDLVQLIEQCSEARL
jgi:hypothetical protein